MSDIEEKLQVIEDAGLDMALSGQKSSTQVITDAGRLLLEVISVYRENPREFGIAAVDSAYSVAVSWEAAKLLVEQPPKKVTPRGRNLK